MAEGRLYDLAGREEETKEIANEEELYRQMKVVSLDDRKRVKCESCVRDRCPRSDESESSDESELSDVSSSSDESSSSDDWSERERRRSERDQRRLKLNIQRYQREKRRLYEQTRQSLYERARQLYKRVAVFLCFACEMYVCAECLPKHRDHDGVKVGRKMNEGMGEQRERVRNEGLGKKSKRMGVEAESEREREREKKKRDNERLYAKKLWDDVMNENESESEEKFKTNKVSIIDRVDVKHKLDQKESCDITGLCGLENKRLVVCDRFNSCIKIFKLGSHVLQRYIRFVESGPWDVTEIVLKQNSSEPNLVSGSSSDISVTDRAYLDKQCLIAVTLPWERQIMFIDLSKKPAKTQKIIQPEKTCYSIQFYDDKIFTVCRDPDSLWSVYIYSTDGDTLNKFNTGIDRYSPVPDLAVVSGRVYLTDMFNNKVKCRNVEGQLISEIKIEWSWPVGISVDPDNNVYVYAFDRDKVYKLDADLTRYKSVLDQTTDYIGEPRALCYYRDKLFISHFHDPLSLQNFVTVVRLL